MLNHVQLQHTAVREQKLHHSLINKLA